MITIFVMPDARFRHDDRIFITKMTGREALLKMGSVE